MNPNPTCLSACLVALVAASPAALAQKDPHVGYVYPAGGQQGAVFQVQVGGQYLDGVSRVIVSGAGLKAEVVEHTKPLSPQQINQLREKFRKLRELAQTQRRKGRRPARPGDFQSYRDLADQVGLTEEDFRRAAEARKRLNDPKRQPNPQIAETVALEVTLAADAEPGPREIRLLTDGGLSNPIAFHVSPWAEVRENEPNDQEPDRGIEGPLPVVVNGQIMPGDVDRFRFEARKGERIVVAVSARELVPYLADAVPGWFQATVALEDAGGREVAYADDFRFHPDPALCYEIPEDGAYVVEIKDAVYRGREDFVYRIALGEVPMVTGVFPLGGRSGEPTEVELAGWNLSQDKMKIELDGKAPARRRLDLLKAGGGSGRVPFALDTLPECLEREPNDEVRSAQQLDAPAIVNGRIDRPGDWDVFRVVGRAGDVLIAEVEARRLGSPLDSVLKLTDAGGNLVAANDDWVDKSAGLTTHHADSRLEIALPAHGAYYVHLGDAQRQGDSARAYRLRVAPPRPDFELRVAPSSINARAGQPALVTVHAVRRDGFDGDITLALTDAPPGCVLSGAWVPAGQSQARATLSVPPGAGDGPIRLSIEGRAEIAGKTVRRTATPAEDMMQAFIYRHLVPSEALMVSVFGQLRMREPVRLLEKGPVALPVGKATNVRFTLPVGRFANQIRLSLSDPPEGVAIADVSHVGSVGVVKVQADPEKAKAGLKGNLIFEAFLERSVGNRAGQAGGRTRRVPIGVLPAVPFEVVGSVNAPEA